MRLTWKSCKKFLAIKIERKSNEGFKKWKLFFGVPENLPKVGTLLSRKATVARSFRFE